MPAEDFESVSLGSMSSDEKENESTNSSATDSDDEPLDFGPNGYFPVNDGLCLKGRYKFLSLLGSGSFATVHKVEDIEAKSTVAMKIGRSGEIDHEICKKEIKILELVSGGSENVVQFTSHFSICGPYGKHLVLVFELLDTDLRTILSSTNEPLCLNTVRKYSKDILNGLDYIHTECGVIHCDLKPENLMISGAGALKIGDFGFAVLNSEKCTDSVGTCHYNPPEVFLNSTISFPMDLWGFGVTLFDMVTKLELFPCDDNECDMVYHMKRIADASGDVVFQKSFEKTTKNQEKFTMFFGGSNAFLGNYKQWLSPSQLRKWRPMMEKDAKEVSDMLKKLLRCDPEKRLTAKQALEHQFLIDC